MGTLKPLPNQPTKLIEIEGLEIHQNGKQASEREFTKWCMHFARLNEWMVYHTEISIRSPAGFPDLVLLRPPELVFAELKSLKPSAKLGPVQQDWLRGLEACEVEVHLWTPSDIPQIIERLKRPSSAW